MTKLKIIQDRIKDFFGFEPLTVLDPDMSVASGASVFHYYTYRGYKPTKIMNDSIGIELAGGIVEHLVPEGTVLPFKSKPIDKFTVEHDGATFIDLPFYMGRRKDTQFPNRKIATRRIKFPKALTSEDKIKLNIEVDEMSMMKINGSINDDKTTHFEVQLLTNKKNFIEEKKVIKKAEIAKKIIDKKPTGKKFYGRE
jgi:molecular chaperone DnaK (HSP70)